MHVVQVLVSLGIGGSEMVAVETTEFLCAAGHRVTVIAANGPLLERVKASGADFLDWPIGRKRLGTLSYIRQLRSWLLENQVDIVHVHSRLPAWICHLALRKLPAKKRPVFITSMHGQYSVSSYSAIMARGDQVIAVSNHIRNYTIKNYLPEDSPHLHTIYGGTSRDDFPIKFRRTPGSHMQNWVECIISNRTDNLHAPVEIGHRSATGCHLVNAAMLTGRELQWDPGSETFLNDVDANKLLYQEPREPWVF